MDSKIGEGRSREIVHPAVDQLHLKLEDRFEADLQLA